MENMQNMQNSQNYKEMCKPKRPKYTAKASISTMQRRSVWTHAQLTHSYPAISASNNKDSQAHAHKSIKKDF